MHAEQLLNASASWPGVSATQSEALWTIARRLSVVPEGP